MTVAIVVYKGLIPVVGRILTLFSTHSLDIQEEQLTNFYKDTVYFMTYGHLLQRS